MQAVKVEDTGVPELGWLDNEDGMLKRVPVDQVFYTHPPVETLQAKKSCLGSDPLYLRDVCNAVLVAGLFPNLARIRRSGKGRTMQGLEVTSAA